MEVQVIRSDGRCVSVVKYALINVIYVQRCPRRSGEKVEERRKEFLRDAIIYFALRHDHSSIYMCVAGFAGW